MTLALPEILAKDLMNSQILAAGPQDKVTEVAASMIKHDYSGMPIVDSKSRLLGLITSKELLDDQGRYLPATIQLLSRLHMAHRGDNPEVAQSLKNYQNLTAADVMNPKPFLIEENALFRDVVEAFVLRNDDIYPVVGKEGKLSGVISKYDILKFLAEGVKPGRWKPDFTIESEQDILQDLEKKFVIVSRTRTRLWLAAGLVFLVLGFIMAFLLVLRINF